MSMPFSTDEQVEKSLGFLRGMEKPACPGCVRGIRMCHYTPCIGTVDDMERLLDAGLAKNLMLDWWVGSGTVKKKVKEFSGKDEDGEDSISIFTEDVMYLAPAIKGYEGRRSPFGKTGTCSFLIENKCSLHDQGLKPTQGQFACCKIKRVYMEGGEEQEIDERIPILHTWNTQRGLDLIERWKKEVNYDGEAEPDLPNGLEDMLEAMLDFTLSYVKLDERAKSSGVPEINYSEKWEQETVTYEKPY